MQSKPLILASSSIYRKELLQKLHLDFICVPSHIEERRKTGESPTQMALRLALEKSHALAPTYPEQLIIASDQVAILNGKQLKKPDNRTKAIEQLAGCSGQAVRFYTSVGILNSKTNEFKSDIDICTVQFKKLSRRQIVNYIDLEQPFNCAGSFKSEGLGIALLESIRGNDPNALIGLPLIKLIMLLEAFNIYILADK